MRYFVRLHFRLALYKTMIVIGAVIPINLWVFHTWGYHDGPILTAYLRSHFWVPPVIGVFILFTVFLVLSTQNEEVLASMEAYQSHAYLMHLKINSALTKIQGVIDLCEHGDHTFNHENCKAVIKRQVRVIQSAMGKVAAVVEDRELEVIKGGRSAEVADIRPTNVT